MLILFCHSFYYPDIVDKLNRYFGWALVITTRTRELVVAVEEINYSRFAYCLLQTKFQLLQYFCRYHR